MLARLFGRNFRSLKDDFELSLIAADLSNSAESDHGIIDVPITGLPQPLRLLRAVALFGPNASGKSTVLHAAGSLRWMVEQSSRSAPVEPFIPYYQPFALDGQSHESPVLLGCEVVFKRSLLRFHISFLSRQIVSEHLSISNGSRQTVLLNRSLEAVEGTLIRNSDVNALYVKDMQPHVSALAKLAQHGPRRGSDSVVPYHDALCRSLRYTDFSHFDANNLMSSNDRFMDDGRYRRWIMNNLIREADVGICDAEARREDVKLPDPLREAFAKIDQSFQAPKQRVVVSFVHKGTQSKALNFTFESAGTRKLFSLSDHWWDFAHDAGTLFGDELGASLHPLLLDRLIRAVNAPNNAGLESQIVFTSHEIGLLESLDGQPPALRRDQVYFTRKKPDGSSELYSLMDFKDDARTVHNIRKRYLSGLYGAIPSVEGVAL